MQGKEEKPEKPAPAAEAERVRAELLAAMTRFPVNSWVQVANDESQVPYQVLGFIAYYRSRTTCKLTIHAELRPARGRTVNQTVLSVNVTALRECEAATEPASEFGPGFVREAYTAYAFEEAGRWLLNQIAASVAIPARLLDDSAEAERKRADLADHEKFIKLDGRFAVAPAQKGFVVRDLWVGESLPVETLSAALGVIAARRQLVDACRREISIQHEGGSVLIWRRVPRPECQRGATCWKVQRAETGAGYQAVEVLPGAEVELRLFNDEATAYSWCAVRAATVTRGQRSTLEVRVPF